MYVANGKDITIPLSFPFEEHIYPEANVSIVS